MANYIPILDSAGATRKVEANELSDGGGNTVDRESAFIGDPTTFAAIAAVKNAEPGSTDYGLITRPLNSGASIYHVVSAASTNAANVRASAGRITGWTIFNNAGYPIYVKFHNTAGTPTAGSGVVLTIGVQAGTSLVFDSDDGIAFATGIGISITKGITDADTVAVAANDCVVNVYHKA